MPEGNTRRRAVWWGGLAHDKVKERGLMTKGSSSQGRSVVSGLATDHEHPALSICSVLPGRRPFSLVFPHLHTASPAQDARASSSRLPSPR